jgi:hypothetical protein
MNSSTTTVKNANNYSLTDADLAALFVSTTPSQTTSNDSMNTLDEVFLNQVNDLVCDKQQTIGPPPGFENFLYDSSSTSDFLLTQTTNTINSPRSSMSNVPIQTPVSSSDTINFSQLLQSTTVGKYSFLFDFNELNKIESNFLFSFFRSSTSNC